MSEDDSPKRFFWSDLRIKQLSNVMNWVFSDIEGKKPYIESKYESIKNILEAINIAKEIITLISAKLPEYYLLSCYKQMIQNAN